MSEGTVRAQAGVTREQLLEALRPLGRRLGPDPGSAQATVGGMVATDASGPRVLRHGSTRDAVRSLRVCWADGSLAEVGRESLAALAEARDVPALARTAEIGLGLADIAARYRAAIESGYPKLPFDRCGYRLPGLVTGDALELARLVVGSEGTLAVVTEATLATIPLAAGRAAVLFGFDSVETALQAGLSLRAHHPAVCDLLDRRLLVMARSHASERMQAIPHETGAVLLAEWEADSPREARDMARAAIEAVQERSKLSTFAVPARDEAAIAGLWEFRDLVLPSLYAVARGRRPLAFVEDLAVPPDALPALLPKLSDLLQRQGVSATVLVHVPAGQVHLRPFLDLSDPADRGKLFPLADAVHRAVLELGGSVAGQHGAGLARLPWLARQFGPLLPAFREVKALFDPRNILNPGKMVPDAEGVSEPWPLRTLPETVPAAGLRTPLLVWAARPPAEEAARCTGCGDCRTRLPAQRQCPIFRVTGQEDATPRAKANLVRDLLDAGPPAPGEPGLADDAVRAIADLCVNCKMCASECSAGVNVPKLMLETRAANQAEHGLSRSDWVFARMEGFAALGSLLSPVVNPLLRWGVSRWLAEKVFGVSRRRRLPRFAWRNFRDHARRAGWARKPPPGPRRVAYFADVFATFNDPGVGRAAVRVLEHNGYTVYVPPGQRGSGMAPLAMGDVETARETAARHLRLFAELAREGFTIVCSEPTAALMFRQDYADLIDDPDAALVASKTRELTEFLGDLHARGELRTDFQPLALAVGHHVPCHLKALRDPEPAAPRLLALIPGMRVRTIDVGCSGMAGAFGLMAKNFDQSLRAGGAMLAELAEPSLAVGSSECSACRMQMEQGSNKRSLHPVQYLALAYGLLPELANRLRTPPRGLVS